MDCFEPVRDIARHGMIEMLHIQKNAIRQCIKGITLLKINVLPSIFEINLSSFLSVKYDFTIVSSSRKLASVRT